MNAAAAAAIIAEAHGPNPGAYAAVVLLAVGPAFVLVAALDYRRQRA